MKINKVTPCGNMVLLRLEEQKKQEDYKKQGLLYVPNAADTGTATATVKNDKKTVVIYVEDIGNLVDQSKLIFKVGDEVFINQYDLLTIGDDDGKLYGLTKVESVLAVIDAARD